MACVYVYVIILTIIGPEYKGRSMDAAHDNVLQEAAGHTANPRASSSGQSSSDGKHSERV